MAIKQMTPDQLAQKWATNLANAQANIRAGVLATREAPNARAARAVDKYIAGCQRAAQDGTYVNANNAVTLQTWQNAMIQKGLPIIADRARQAIPQMSQFFLVWMQYQENFQSQLAQMPRGTLEQNIQRATAQIRYNAAFRDLRAQGRFRSAAGGTYTGQ